MVSSTNKQLLEQQQKNQVLNQQIDRLKSLIENLDQNKEELLKRLQSTSKEIKSEESDKAILMNDIQTYKRELIQKDQEVYDLK